MSQLQSTNLVVQAANLPTQFEGTPQEFFAAMLARMRIMSPSGTNFFVIGDQEPTSNVGPWLKGGTQWYVFDETPGVQRYMPLDIGDSETKVLQIGKTTPTSNNPPIWLRTNDQDKAMSWYFWNGTAWEVDQCIIQSGPTSARPDPVTAKPLQRFYDEDIGCEIWFERGQWRTVAGSPGDVKYVMQLTLAEARRFNPGWEALGAEAEEMRGRLLSMATKDPGTSPVDILTVSAGVAQRAAHEVFGETDGVKMDSSSSVPYPPTLALWCLVKS
jgi:hypothetical protein